MSNLISSSNPALETLQQEWTQLHQQGVNVISISKSMAIPTNNTPTSLYLKLRRGSYSYLLESAQLVGECKRIYTFYFSNCLSARKFEYSNSIIGCEPYRVVKSGEDATKFDITGDPVTF